MPKASPSVDLAITPINDKFLDTPFIVFVAKLDTDSSSDGLVSPPWEQSLPVLHTHPQRDQHPPPHLSNYVYGVTSPSFFPLHHYISLKQLNSPHCTFISKVLDQNEPRTYSQIAKFPVWGDAMVAELNALKANNTWKLCTLSPEKTTICCKWVYKIKFSHDGSIDHYKACLCAKGYTQQEGIDYHETFTPVTKLVTVCVLISIASTCNWSYHQLNVNNAFLQGDLDEDIFFQLPPSLSHSNNIRVCKLPKSLYSLKQASRQ
ncbi:hypothetical protein IC582_025286 [Cucumis melo]